MSDGMISAALALVTGIAVYENAAALEFPVPWGATVALLGMAAAGMVTWGMFKKATERHETEIELLRHSLNSIHKTLSDVRERIARIEGKLEQE